MRFARAGAWRKISRGDSAPRYRRSSRAGEPAVRGAGASSDSRWGASLLGLVVAAIVAHRLFLALSTDFVINDGGLFYAFIEAIGDTFPGLPHHAAYNDLAIPFAYPPLSFWIGALLVRTGADPTDIVHYMPIAMNLAYVLLFGLLLRRNGASPLFVALALLFLCINKRSFEWLVMGGGMSR